MTVDLTEALILVVIAVILLILVACAVSGFLEALIKKE